MDRELRISPVTVGRAWLEAAGAPAGLGRREAPRKGAQTRRDGHCGHHRRTLCRVLAVACLLVTMLALDRAEAVNVIGVELGGADAQSHPSDTGIFSVGSLGGPAFSTTTGIGFIVNPSLLQVVPPTNLPDFSMHDHAYTASFVPNSTRAVVTYEFDVPLVVDEVEIIQHFNGISRISGFAGNSLGSLTPLGDVLGSAGVGPFTDGASSVFDFPLDISGKFFRFVVTQTFHPGAYAAYRAYPRDLDGIRCDPDCPGGPQSIVPEPTSFLLFASGLAGAGGLAWHRRRRK